MYNERKTKWTKTQIGSTSKNLCYMGVQKFRNLNLNKKDGAVLMDTGGGLPSFLVGKSDRMNSCFESYYANLIMQLLIPSQPYPT